MRVKKKLPIDNDDKLDWKRIIIIKPTRTKVRKGNKKQKCLMMMVTTLKDR
mgnify:CR=1 FL=1